MTRRAKSRLSSEDEITVENLQLSDTGILYSPISGCFRNCPERKCRRNVEKMVTKLQIKEGEREKKGTNPVIGRKKKEETNK